MADVDHHTELFAPLGGVTFKRMFGGHGIMRGGMMFALISRDALYFKTDDALAARFKAEGSRQWTPNVRGKTMAMPYWQVPERLYDEPDEFAAWAREAFDAAERMRAQKKPARKRTAKKPAPKAKAPPKRRAPS